ncbi:hypothetical protein [Chthoniobacter flavus]|uniref:hypothetical protein n=1 Tax=Chthoniobacter flavus TaxID=191863 RepID=UPI001ED91E7A|nr:hypothetical protein [Chthoniobacter flavus]
MSAKLISPELRPVYDKVLAGQRVTDDEALQLYATHDLNGLGVIAQHRPGAKERQHRHLHP